LQRPEKESSVASSEIDFIENGSTPPPLAIFENEPEDEASEDVTSAVSEVIRQLGPTVADAVRYTTDSGLVCSISIRGRKHPIFNTSMGLCFLFGNVLFPVTSQNADLVHDEILEREKDSERPDETPAPVLPSYVVVNADIDPVGR
jgi:hypothetical protein